MAGSVMKKYPEQPSTIKTLEIIRLIENVNELKDKQGILQINKMVNFMPN